MPEPLKNIYSKSFIEGFSTLLQSIKPDLDKSLFISNIFNENWKAYELKQRMQHIADILHIHLGKNFKIAIPYILELVNIAKTLKEEMSFGYMFLPNYVETYGLDYYNESINAMEEITKFTSCEFAVRPFLKKHPEQMVEQMLLWSKHDNAMVRRLASEGMRPRLPWGMGVPYLKNNPSIILPILEQLKNDHSETVRRSVANNLNDISKDHPELVNAIVDEWKDNSNKELSWVIRHACRTLLKQGNPRTLEFFGYNSKSIQVRDLKVLTPKVKIGNSLSFEFVISNLSNNPTLIRIEYGIYFKKANGKLSRKVFKISEKTIDKNSTIKVNRKQSFKEVTTRKLYKGQHKVSVIINGNEFIEQQFELI